MKDTITSRGITFPRPSSPEKTEQAAIVELVQKLGGRAYVLGSKRAQTCGLCGGRTTDQGTRQSEGLGDLAVYLPPPRVRGLGDPLWAFAWIECKGKGGTLSPEQVESHEINERARVPHIVGGLDAVLAWLGPRGVGRV